MSKRRSTLSDKLNPTSEKRPGWRDTIRPSIPVEAEPEDTISVARVNRANRDKPRRKTYLLLPDMIERIAILAEEERVGINELVRFLLSHSLDQIENGRLEIPTAPGRRRISP